MHLSLDDALLLPLALALLIAAATDLRSRTIPNGLNLAVALGAPLFWWASALPLWPDAALQVLSAFLIFLLFFAAFAARLMGGGDVKLLAAVALWLPPSATIKLLVIMSLMGGLVTLLAAAHHALKRAEGRAEIPYGVAISGAGLWLIGERYLYHFSA